MSEENINETVDLDLKADDARLRESLGTPTTINLPDGGIVHVANIGEWNGPAMRYASNGDWDNWASEVIDDEDELLAFLEAGLVNYQLEAVFETCAKNGGVGGKSKRSGSSSGRTHRR